MEIVILLAGIIIGMVACVMLAESLKDKPKNISMERSIKKRITVTMFPDGNFGYQGKLYIPHPTTIVGDIKKFSKLKYIPIKK